MSAAAPLRNETVTRDLLLLRAEATPDQTFLDFGEGLTWTYPKTVDLAFRLGHLLQAHGVKQGDPVAVFLPNCPETVQTWFGINSIGAVYCPINTAYQGALLQHVLRTVSARVMVTDVPSMKIVRDAGVDLDKFILIDADVSTVLSTHEEVAFDEHRDFSSEAPSLARPIEPWDTQSVIFTSGTTGPSKGVMSSYAHLTAMARETSRQAGPDDRHLVDLPLFHASGTMPIHAMLMTGGSVAVRSRFTSSRYWDVAKESGSTISILLGAMATFLDKRPPGPSDRGHGLRLTYLVPVSVDAAAFEERFGVEVRTRFNMTETSQPIVSGPRPATLGACGRIRQGVEARIVDEFDYPVPAGEVGELLLRTENPWELSHGYINMPEETARAWQNGWFHTGDSFRADPEGNYSFVDRRKDAIRRRGENISSFEVENAILGHPSVLAVAVVPVPSDESEDEVLAAVVRATSDFSPRELFLYCQANLPYFMVPRYIRVVDEIPSTPTNKRIKQPIRDAGITSDTWDCEQEGLQIGKRADTTRSTQ